MLREIRPAIVVLVALTLATGLAYPLAITGIAQIVFPRQAQGSMIERDGHVVGSALIGQTFADDKYFHGRPSATTAPDPNDSTKSVAAPYNAANSGGSNLGPSNKGLIDRVQGDLDQAQAGEPRGPGPHRPGHHLGERPRPRHLARGCTVPGAPYCQGAQSAGESRPRARRRPDGGSFPRIVGRAPRQRPAAQFGARPVDLRIGRQARKMSRHLTRNGGSTARFRTSAFTGSAP